MLSKQSSYNRYILVPSSNEVLDKYSLSFFQKINKMSSSNSWKRLFEGLAFSTEKTLLHSTAVLAIVKDDIKIIHKQGRLMRRTHLDQDFSESLDQMCVFNIFIQMPYCLCPSCRWSWPYGIQQDKKTMIDLGLCHTPTLMLYLCVFQLIVLIV